ncbi:MAG: hypothetical protein ACOCRO_06020 [Halanaerobiales bacterium]
MKKLIIIIILILLTVFVVGCNGTEINVDNLEGGMSFADVEDIWGEPDEISHQGTGYELWVYDDEVSYGLEFMGEKLVSWTDDKGNGEILVELF